ncbi:hypothetical protein WMF28_04425 [Sorangium sp. So ce590]|uniref:hypothetical protein n=1 Tax=Sorangium sp. So ce590 TaxID=3133317 RepID=UPI003F6392EB
MYSRKKRRRTTLIGEARADFAGVTLFLVFVLVFAPISRGVRAFPPILQRFRAVFAPSRGVRAFAPCSSGVTRNVSSTQGRSSLDTRGPGVQPGDLALLRHLESVE